MYMVFQASVLYVFQSVCEHNYINKHNESPYSSLILIDHRKVSELLPWTLFLFE